MRNKSGGPGKSFGKKSDSGDGRKSFGKGKPSFSGKGRDGKSFGDKEKSFSKRDEGSSSDESKPKKRVFTSADFGGESKSRSNSYSKSFDKGSDDRGYAKKKEEGEASYGSYERKPKREYGDKKEFGDKKSYGSETKPRSKGGSDSYSAKRKSDGFESYEEKPRKEYGDKKSFGEKRTYSSDKFGDKKPYGKKEGDSSYGDKPRKEYGDKKSFGDKKPYSKRDGDSYGDKPRKEFGDKKSFGDKKPFVKRDGDSYGEKKSYSDRKSFSSEGSGDKKHRVSKRNFIDKGDENESRSFEGKRKDGDNFRNDGKRPRIAKKSFSKSNPENDGKIRLNKYIANSGVCSRREADKLIESGAVTVNGKIVAELGYKVSPEDVITYGGQAIKRERKVYVLLNKPKDYITTLDDPEGRKTVMELLKNTGKERIYPVGRLDRNTTGLLMLTNDGDMAMKLTHPKHNIQKMYAVDIDKGIKPEDLKALMEGIELEDGPIKADKVEIVGEGSNRKEIGIEIHSGKNRIVRRMFEHLGYNVVRLDRVMFAGLTKKDLPRGKWRFLTDKEINFLKML